MSPWRALRAALRLTFTCLSVLVSLLVLTPTLGLRLVAPRASARWCTATFRTWCRLNLALLGARVEVRGNPPTAPFFLVSNHLSYLDILVLGSRLDTVFVSKAEVRGWLVMGLVSRMAGTIFIDRSMKRDIPRVLEEIENRLRFGRGVVVFPEGTSSSGVDLPRFRPSLLETAVQTDCPVHYASLAYEALPGENPAYQTICWWGDMTFFDHFFHLLSMPGWSVLVVFGDDPIEHGDRKQLAERLHVAVGGLFEPSAPAGTPTGTSVEDL